MINFNKKSDRYFLSLFEVFITDSRWQWLSLSSAHHDCQHFGLNGVSALLPVSSQVKVNVAWKRSDVVGGLFGGRKLEDSGSWYTGHTSTLLQLLARLVALPNLHESGPAGVFGDLPLEARTGILGDLNKDIGLLIDLEVGLSFRDVVQTEVHLVAELVFGGGGSSEQGYGC